MAAGPRPPAGDGTDHLETSSGPSGVTVAGLIPFERDYAHSTHAAANLLAACGMNVERCTWCGTGVDADDGFRAYEAAGARRAVFCRLEHVVPWAIQDAHWEAGEIAESEGIDDGEQRCSHCDQPVDPEVHVLLVRHRGAHRIPDDFCSVEHMLEWAKGGGRWQ